MAAQGFAQQAPRAGQPRVQRDQDPRLPSRGNEELFPYSAQRAKVALMHGDSRRKNVSDALAAIDAQIRPVLRTRKSVVIKVNGVSPQRQLACTHVDAIHGALDYLAPRFKGPVTIVECCANPSAAAENWHWDTAGNEHKPMNVKFVNLNDEKLYKVFNLIDFDLHPMPVRLAARMLDPDAFLMHVGPMKTHNTVVATLSIKNMVLGAPLQSPAAERPSWNDKRKFHTGVRQTNYNMMLTAQFMKPNWGAAVLDGFEGMEGNGPGGGTPVDQRIAVASTDFLAADRVGVECMGIDASWIGYMNYCHQTGLGQFDLGKIDIEGAKIADVVKKYQLHADIERERLWQGPMEELPPNLG